MLTAQYTVMHTEVLNCLKCENKNQHSKFVLSAMVDWWFNNALF